MPFAADSLIGKHLQNPLPPDFEYRDLSAAGTAGGTCASITMGADYRTESSDPAYYGYAAPSLV